MEKVLVAGVVCAALFGVANPPLRADESLTSLVQPLVGTARKDQAIGATNSGQTYPAVGVPFAMTHWSPQTQASEDKCISPYYAQDTAIQGFRGTHWWSGSCTHDYGSVTVAVMTGALRVDPVARASHFRREQEVMSPGYYAVTLHDHGVKAELTGTARAGVMRFTFANAGQAHLLVQANHKKDERRPDGFAEALPSQREIVGTSPVRRLYAGKGKSAGFSGHFVARFDVPVSAYGSFSGSAVRAGAPRAQGDLGAPGAYITLPVKAGQVVTVQLGTSFTSVAEARANLDAEIGTATFDEVRSRSEAIWEQALGRIRIKGGSAEQRSVYYTAFYHSLLMPRLFSDVSGSYPGFAGSPVQRTEGWDYYDDFSLWDTFRAVHPLMVLTQRQRVPHFVRSLVAKAQQGGWLPNFPGWNSYTSAMVGDHGAAVIADAVVKGIPGIDVDAAYAALRKNALQTPDTAQDYLDGKGRRALGDYLKYGFIPLEQEVNEAFHKREQVSRTLEYGYDDFAVAQVARALSKTQDAQLFLKRSAAWKKVFDPSVGFVRGRHADGRWAESFDPGKEQSYITEGTPWQYSFFVPHDVQGLIAAMGGRTKFVAKLDQFFAEKHYWHGNEPSHHIAYLYNFAGAPWKGQAQLRQIMKDEYSLGPTGLKGNDDTGQLSAWYVFSAAGLYPVCPGSPQYEIGSPLFEEVRIDVGDGKAFVLKATGASAQNLYIQSATLNGKRYDKAWLHHNDVAKGGTLVLLMGPKPNPRWGARR